jgi:hypothetical protein
MACSGAVEPVNVLEDCSFCLPPCHPFMSPDEFGFRGFEKCLDVEHCHNNYPDLTALGRPLWLQSAGMTVAMIDAHALRQDRRAQLHKPCRLIGHCLGITFFPPAALLCTPPVSSSAKAVLYRVRCAHSEQANTRPLCRLDHMRCYRAAVAGKHN